jgi:tellurite resistance protein TerC
MADLWASIWSKEVVVLAGFHVFVLIMLALDLGVFHRSAHAVSMKEAAVWSIV